MILVSLFQLYRTIVPSQTISFAARIICQSLANVDLIGLCIRPSRSNVCAVSNVLLFYLYILGPSSVKVAEDACDRLVIGIQYKMCCVHWNSGYCSEKYLPVRYVRHGEKTSKHRAHREKWGLSMAKLMPMSYNKLVPPLQHDGILPNWHKRTCPHCGEGQVGKLQRIKSKKAWLYRCRTKVCQRFLCPHDLHPIFFQGQGIRCEIVSNLHYTCVLYHCIRNNLQDSHQNL